MFIIMFIISGVAYGGDTDTNLTNVDNIKKGSFALQFKVNENFKITDFNGALISAKYHYSKSAGIQFGFEINSSRDKSEYNIMAAPDYSTDERIIEICMLIQHILYIKKKASSGLYWGIGPFFNLSNIKERYIEYTSPDDSFSRDYRNKVIGIGITNSFGVEIYIWKNLSLLAEYNLSLKYEYEKKHDFIIPPGERIKNHFWTLKSDEIKVGFSVYF